jgi:hypothetical protein
VPAARVIHAINFSIFAGNCTAGLKLGQWLLWRKLKRFTITFCNAPRCKNAKTSTLAQSSTRKHNSNLVDISSRNSDAVDRGAET